MHELEISDLRQRGGNAVSERWAAMLGRLDSLFAAQEALIPVGGYQRRPSVKAPEGALELLRHERHAILDYFIGPRMLHAFVITRKETHYRVIPRPPDFSARIREFSCMLSRSGADAAEFQQLAYSLYGLLVAPMEDLITEIDQLTIVPDARMRFIPMGALVRQAQPRPDYRSLHYLLNDFGISYALSVAHLAQVHERGHPKGEGLALFGGKAVADRELQGIRTSWAGKPESGYYHLETDLAKQGPVAELIHLAGAGSMRAGDLAGIDLDLSLASVSGTGMYLCEAPAPNDWLIALEAAGARSIVLQAWDTQDAAAEEIWAGFYRALADRQYVDQALRTAQLEYLATAPDEACHPGYWAGWMQFDDFSPVRDRGHFPWYVFLVAGFLLIVILGKRL
jgi:hypothetical protein